MVLQVFEVLHANLPPTLSKSQVSSVRKQLKMHITTLFKIPRYKFLLVFLSFSFLSLNALQACAQFLSLLNLPIRIKLMVSETKYWATAGQNN